MTHHNGADSAGGVFPTDEELRERWYIYAATKAGSIGFLLAILRSRQGQNIEEQQAEFAISAKDFVHLQSLRLPRAEQFASDAERMAAACHVGKPFEFIQAILLARNVIKTSSNLQFHSESEEQSYEAAYDASGIMEDSENGE